jgi:hypothetical protein
LAQSTLTTPKCCGGLAEARQEIAHLLLAGVDDLAGWGLFDGIGHPPAELLELRAQLLHEGLGGDLRLALHGFFLGVCLAEANGPPGPLAVHRLKYALPEELPRPANPSSKLYRPSLLLCNY